MDTPEIVGAQIRGETVRLDGGVYSRCLFTDCLLLFAGTEYFVLSECTLENCTFEFVDDAKRTLDQLASLHQFGYHELVEGFLDKVRNRSGATVG